MSRRQIVAGNWKMNNLYDDGIQLALNVSRMVAEGFATRSGVTPLVVVSPPYFLLPEIARIVKDVEGLVVAAQNASSESAGAFTGEVSAAMVASAGVSHVIIGHSERRTLFGEGDAVLKMKVDQVIENGLELIFCVGEILEQRLENRHFDVVKQQLRNSLFHLDSAHLGRVIIAYEPVWAIGTGHNATPEQAQEMHLFIRNCVEEQYGEEIAQNTSLLYGGSCKPDNATDLFSMPDVDGGLIGGASLKADDFAEIIKSI